MLKPKLLLSCAWDRKRHSNMAKAGKEFPLILPHRSTPVSAAQTGDGGMSWFSLGKRKYWILQTIPACLPAPALTAISTDFAGRQAGPVLQQQCLLHIPAPRTSGSRRDAFPYSAAPSCSKSEESTFCGQQHGEVDLKDTALWTAVATRSKTENRWNILIRDGQLWPPASQTNPSISPAVQVNLGIVCRIQYFIVKLSCPRSPFSAYLPCWWLLFTQLKPRPLLNSVLEPPREPCSQHSPPAVTDLPRAGTAASMTGRKRVWLVHAKAAAWV